MYMHTPTHTHRITYNIKCIADNLSRACYSKSYIAKINRNLAINIYKLIEF